MSDGARVTFFGANTVGQEPWELRGASDARIASLETRATALEADQSKVRRYYSLVGRSSATAVTSGAIHTIDFDTVVYEDVAFFNNAANTWTIPVSGLWSFELHVTYTHDANTGTDCTGIWNVDGSRYEGTRGFRTSGNGMGSYSKYLQPLNAGQVVTPEGFVVATNPFLHGTGNTLQYTRAMVHRIGPL